MDESWIKFYRKSRENFLYKTKKPHTRREAWEDMLLEVNFTDEFCILGNEKIECKRGQSTLCLESWGKVFNWKSKSKVKRFFDLLKKNEMICVENLVKTTRITICNYESYQGDRNTDETQMKRKRNTDETQTKPIKEYKERKEEKNISTSKFDLFWDTYDKKVGREKCLEAWKNIPESEIEKILEHVPRYVASTPDIKYRKNPLTYLNGKHWNDEIICQDSSTSSSSKTLDGRPKLVG